jgi:hypothetical protein
VKRVWQELRLLNNGKEDQMSLEQMMIEMGKLLGHEEARSGSTQLPEAVRQRVYSSFFVDCMKKVRK